MSDIEKSFVYLHDSIPSWFSNIGEIEERVANLQSEMNKVPVSGSMPMKRRTGSVESIRDLDGILEDPATSTTPQQSSRKRKTPSVLSHASGPSKYRSRTMVVVQYDGQVQKSFETLVRNIGTGRNMLRKGKMAARMEALAELAGPDDADDDDDSDDSGLMSKIGYRHRAGLSPMRTRGAMRLGRSESNNPSSGTPVELFDSTDKALEHAQGLCERAAHQSLRDGNCRKELEGVRKHLEDVLEAATREVEKFNARKEKDVPKEDLEIESSPPLVVVQPKALLPNIRPAPATAHTTLKAVDIEVDDDEEDDVDFVMPPIRFTSRA
ncbi:hypothetical protein K505DRAFT_320734 [Melanomma pulvis-pyrius CBS 109.77]|uniref:Uncharacterized protein n=1 Tax=Melanomma pulvis-pyrius CBS 109.77 TaxID=1314802 RepID=A0A6A6XV38_9PLEO|nr:hypothetical protein K505DRAFT_320734 [Melanomma pulvis-pyrius CBS 109.77]